MVIREIFSKEFEGIKAAFVAILSIILFNNYDFLGIKGRFNDTIALSLYGILGTFAYIFFQATYQWLFVVRRIKINPVSETRSEPLLPPVSGTRYFIDLEVETPKGWEITDCYATLDKVVPVFYQDRKLLKPQIAEWLAEITNPKHRRLIWESHYSNNSDCTMNVVDNNKERFSLACVNIGSFKNKRKKIDVNWLEFRMCGDNPSTIKLRQFGLYKIAVTFHWKRDEKKMISRVFNGYLYSEPRERIPYVILGSGNYAKDKRVPKPAT